MSKATQTQNATDLEKLIEKAQTEPEEAPRQQTQYEGRRTKMMGGTLNLIHSLNSRNDGFMYTLASTDASVVEDSVQRLVRSGYEVVPQDDAVSLGFNSKNTRVKLLRQPLGQHEANRAEAKALAQEAVNTPPDSGAEVDGIKFTQVSSKQIKVPLDIEK